MSALGSRSAATRWMDSCLRPAAAAMALLLAGLVTVVLPCRSGRAADEGVLRLPVTTYLAGLEARDADAALASWSAQSPNLKGLRGVLAAQFKASAENRVKNVKWGRTWEDAKGAWVQVNFDLEARPAAANQPDPSQPAQRRTFQLVSETGAWKIWRNALSERVLAEALLHAEGKDARETRLQLDIGLLSATLIQQLRIVTSGESSTTSVEVQLARYELALELAERLKDPKEIARVYIARGGVLYRKDRYAEATADYSRAIALLQTLDEPDGLGIAQFNLGMVLVEQHQFQEALPLLEASAANAGKAGSPQRVAQARYWIGYSKHSLLDHAGALPAYQTSADLSRQVKDLPGEARALSKVGDIYKVLHRDAEAIPAWERAANLYRDAGMPREEIEVLASLGLTEGALNNYVGAYTTQMRRLKASIALGNARIIADSLSSLALLLGVLGQSESEAGYLESEVTFRQRAKDALGEAKALRALGDSYRDLSRFADAAESFQKALEIGRRLPDKEQEARALAALARLNGERGDYAHASEQGEQAVRLFRELNLKSAEADAVRELGKQYRAQGRHADALAQFDASFKLDQEAEDVLGAVRDLDETAQDHLLTGRYQDALNLYQGSLKAYRDAKLRLGEADIHNKLGATLKLLARYTEAEAEYQQSFDISKELGLDAGQQQARANLAALHATTGRYDEALIGYEAALEGFRKLRARSAEATTITNLGKLYSSKGDLNRAQAQHETALAIYRELKDERSVAQEIYNLADLNADRARYAEALAGFAEALKTFRTAGLKLDEANTLSAQANVYRQLAQPAQALALYEQSRQIRTQIGDRAGLARVTASVANLHHEAGREPEALKGYEEALATVRSLGEKPDEPGLLNNLSVVLQSLKRPAEAQKRLQEALVVTRKLGKRSDEAFSMGNLAFLQMRQGKLAEAEATYRETLKIAEESGLPDISFRCWFGLGLLHQEQKQWRVAARDLARATGLIDRIRSDVREQSLQTSFLQQFVSPFHLQADTLVSAGEPAAAYLAGERARARALVDVLRNGKVNVTKSLTPTERQMEEKLTGRLTSLTAELLQAQFLPTDQKEARESQVAETRGALEQLRRQLFLAHPQLQAQRGDFSPATLTQLNQSLFRQEPSLCVLSYLVGYRETLLFAITRGKSPTGPAALSVYRLPISRKELEERGQAFWMECSQSGGQYRAPGQKLYRDLIQPAGKDLAGKTQVVLVPDGPLHSLPFQALVNGQGKHLVEQLALSYAPSVSALQSMVQLGDRRRSERPTGGVRLLAFGRPKLDPSLSDLPATEKEVRTLSRLFGQGAEVVTGAEASEERFKTAAAGARYLHLATHGLVNERAPMYSALALAHGTGEDGRLEARELGELDLRADLVVLSACETALGKTVRGEGVLGLTWSLFVAGAPSTVVSHWQVEDETTGALMAQFYRKMLPAPKPQLGASVSKAGALRAAQLTVMRDGKHAHPYYWAPFILVGDWRGGVAR